MFRSTTLRAIQVGLTVASALVWLASPASAQAVYGAIHGSVTDTSGAALPGVTVTITSVERQTVDSVVTNESGLYAKERLIPGVYEVKAELASFKAAVVPRVQVSVDAQTPVDFKLEIGQLTETVEVSGGSPLLKTDRADVATTFDQKQLTEAPVIDRNFTKFILLTPGAQQLGWQHAASENPQGSTQTMVNGQSFSGTGYQLDGTENRDPILGIIVINPNLEAIGEAMSRRRTMTPSSDRRLPASYRCRRSQEKTSSSALHTSSSGTTTFRRGTRSPSRPGRISLRTRGTSSGSPWAVRS